MLTTVGCCYGWVKVKKVASQAIKDSKISLYLYDNCMNDFSIYFHAIFSSHDDDHISMLIDSEFCFVQYSVFAYWNRQSIGRALVYLVIST